MFCWWQWKNRLQMLPQREREREFLIQLGSFRGNYILHKHLCIHKQNKLNKVNLIANTEQFRTQKSKALLNPTVRCKKLHKWFKFLLTFLLLSPQQTFILSQKIHVRSFQKSLSSGLQWSIQFPSVEIVIFQLCSCHVQMHKPAPLEVSISSQ